MTLRNQRAMETTPKLGKFRIGQNSWDIAQKEYSSGIDVDPLTFLADVHDDLAVAAGVTSDVYGTVTLETGEDPLAEDIQSEGINAADLLCGKVMPLLRYLDIKLGKYGGPSNVESYVELVRNMTRMKVAAARAIVKKDKQLQDSEEKDEVLWKRLAEEKELRKSSEKAYESLRTDIEITRRVKVNLRNRLEASRVAFNEDSLRMDELNADMEKND
ncbi:hypothetical protein AXG93_496s1020 [Marchantia polymorpha subsp. ruderalis]|uniref:Uncharacterized protein n=1 Tax=Marchantia polymorpha subsp. ruderalis TaxID=1480154 RepID=A0A176VQ79_MARPO|nr:hypothetical protein AXG93_496s1020 [Marchantia polymorpha subsp. ruderalis]